MCFRLLPAVPRLVEDVLVCFSGLMKPTVPGVDTTSIIRYNIPKATIRSSDLVELLEPEDGIVAQSDEIFPSLHMCQFNIEDLI